MMLEDFSLVEIGQKKIAFDNNSITLSGPAGNVFQANLYSVNIYTPSGYEALYVEDYWTALRVRGADLLTGEVVNRLVPDENTITLSRPNVGNILYQDRYDTFFKDSNLEYFFTIDLVNNHRSLHNYLGTRKIDFHENIKFLDLDTVSDISTVSKFYVKNTSGDLEELLLTDIKKYFIYKI